MSTLGKWILGIVGLIIVASVISSLTRSGGASDEDRWAESFVPVLGAINRAGVEPARAMIEVESCQTTLECDRALLKMRDSMILYRPALTTAIGNLPNNPPSSFQNFQHDYRTMLELRLEAINLYIQGINGGNFAVIEKGDQIWFEATLAASDMIDELEKILK